MEKPILFNTEMVQAILEGRKTQTRRTIKLPEGMTGKPVGEAGNSDNPLGFMYPCGIKRPPYKAGDILWVRETWCKIPNIRAFRVDIWFKADYKDGEFDELIKEFPKAIKWHPSIHMPRAAARIFLKVTDVRVQRLQDITIEQAICEGAMNNPPAFSRAIMRDCHNQNLPYAIASFAVIWDRTIKEKDINLYGWDANPWVWVIEFERLEG